MYFVLFDVCTFSHGFSDLCFISGSVALHMLSVFC